MAGSGERVGNKGGRREARRRRPRPQGGRKVPGWMRLPLEACLDVRVCDLGLEIEGSPLEEPLERLDEELDRAGLVFRPYTWLSDDWFTPDGVTGFAIPFYLAHPRLARLERKHMFEVEGGTRDSCLRILRHETAHALDNAYRLRRRRRWREVFGRVSEPYRASYDPDPDSRSFVHNLDGWYSQSHPLEDFAETFAVWLQPRSGWRRRYAGWPALAKLEYVDELMDEIADQDPPVRTRRRADPASRLTLTLREYYARKAERYHDRLPTFLDVYLQRLFAPAEGKRRERAAAFLRRVRPELKRRVTDFAGHHPYVVAQALREMVMRCEELDLRVKSSGRGTVHRAAMVLMLVTVRYLRGAHPGYRR